MSKKPLFLLFTALAMSLGCMAQDVQINEPPRVAALFDTWVRQNRIEPGISGWRVQLVSSTDRNQVIDGKSKFDRQFPDVPADWVHEKPYYKLRVGAFQTRLEAAAFVEEIRAQYPGAYPAKDRNIHPRDFLRP